MSPQRPPHASLPPQNNSVSLLILGCGVAVGDAKRNQSSYLVQGGGTQILLEAGSGTLRALVGSGIDPCEVDAFCFSHFHPDHITDLVPLLLHCKIAEKPRRKDLLILGPKGMRLFFNRMSDAYFGSFLPKTFTVQIHELSDTDTVSVGAWTVQGYRVPHFQGSLGFRLEHESRGGKKAIAFTGDTQYGENLVNLARNVDLFLAEASLPHTNDLKGHLSPRLAGRVAQKARAKHLVLTHLYRAALRGAPKQIAAEEFSGSISLAEDAMVLRP
jgi:ribonuclease BN (tRNA processing enzyme)